MERSLSELVTILESVACSLGIDVLNDWRDEHVRWDLYREAINRAELRGRLQEALALEPDEGVATSVVLLAFDLDPDGKRMLEWVHSLPERYRPFVEKRARETVILRGLCDGSFSGDVSLGEWTHWLQRQAAERALVRPVLAALVDGGQTRKIRNIAGERLRVGDRQGIWRPQS